MTSNDKDNDNLELEEVYSKIHDERKCVTTKSLALEMGITRKKAASLLEAIPYYQLDQQHHSDDEKPIVYDVVRCVLDDSKDGKCVVRLQKSQLKINPKQTPSKSTSTQQSKNTIHSLALNINNQGSTTPQNAHAYTMTLLFNALEDGSLMEKIQNDSIVQPAEEIVIENQENLRRRRIDAMNGKHDSSTKASGSKNGGGNVKSGSNSNTMKKKTPMQKTTSKKKITTAAAFFGSSTTTKATKKTNNTKTNPINTKPNKEKSDDLKNGDKTKNGKDSVTSHLQQHSKRKNAPKSSSSLSSSSTSSSSNKKPKITKGNADDFVGDEDEDDEFLQEEKERKERIAEHERKVAKQKAKQKNQKIVISNDANNMDMDVDKNANDDNDDDNHGDNVEEEKKKKKKKKENVTGAMDTFTTANNNPNKVNSTTDNLSQDGSGGGGSRKRRKQVMEEKTFIDDNGFFRTETVAVWKEIEAEDGLVEKVKAKAAVASKPKKLKSTKGMKQQGLKGFFVVKKK